MWPNMNKNQKKECIQNLLREQGSSASAPVIAQLLEAKDAKFSTRTVRRLLGELYKDGKVEREGTGSGTKYSIKSSESDPALPFSQNVLSIIEAVKRPIFNRQPVSYNKSWVSAYIPNKTFYFSEHQRKEMSEKGLRNKGNKIEPAGTYSRKILDRLMIDISYESSRLEGNTYSRGETEALVLHGKKGGGKLDAEHVMVMNHKLAIDYLVRNASELNVSYKVVCTLHYYLSDALVLATQMGKVRNEGVRISGTTYLPLEDKARLESNLKSLIITAEEIDDPYEQSLFLLIHIAYLQPFIDINKRTARLSANIPFIRSNRVPLSFQGIEPRDYINAMLAVYEQNEVSPLAELYYRSYLRTCAAYDVTVESLGYDPIRAQYRQLRRNIVTVVIRDLIDPSEIEAHILQAAQGEVEPSELGQFISSVIDDLKNLSVITIEGLGISQQEFERWGGNDLSNLKKIT